MPDSYAYCTSSPRRDHLRLLLIIDISICVNFNHIAKTEHIVDYAMDYQEEDFGYGTCRGIDEY